MPWRVKTASSAAELGRNCLLHLVGRAELELDLRRSCILRAPPRLLSGGPCSFAITRPEAIEVVFRQLFDIQQSIVGSLDGTDQCIQCQLDRFTIDDHHR
jgi:hypothetical protein